MILTDGTSTYTNLDEDVVESPQSNTSTIVTRGGKRIQQGDYANLAIVSTVRVKQSDFPTLHSILTNWGATLTYTPARTLAYKTAADAMTVVVKSWTKIKQSAWAGEIVFHLEIELEEVVGA